MSSKGFSAVEGSSRDLSLSGPQIRKLRAALRWTQAQFARLLEVHASTISRWECGKSCPRPLSAKKLGALAANIRARQESAQGPAVPVQRLSAVERASLLSRIGGRRVVASVSGGKDSAALSLYLTELGIEHERVFLDTGWESDLTYKYLREELPRVIGPITWVTPPKQMEDIIRSRGMFPGRRIRFCTQELKIWPMARYLRGLMDQGLDVINAVGVRAAESASRAQLPEWEWQEGFDAEVWRPLIAWSEADVIDIHKRHGLRPNPLYLFGARRVGCWPCIFARKSDVRLLADIDPKRVVRLRVLEEQVGCAAQKRAERDGRELRNLPTWFQNPLSTRLPDGKRDGSCWPIERVVAWSRSALRGPLLSKDDFLFSAHLDGCMRWGLCEATAQEAAG